MVARVQKYPFRDTAKSSNTVKLVHLDSTKGLTPSFGLQPSCVGNPLSGVRDCRPKKFYRIVAFSSQIHIWQLHGAPMIEFF